MRMRAKYVNIVKASCRDVAESWAQSYLHPKEGWRASPLAGGRTAKGIYDELCGLGPSPRSADVAEIIGNKSWSYVNCDGCGEYTEIGVKIGSEDDGKVYCETCLKEALILLSGNSVP